MVQDPGRKFSWLFGKNPDPKVNKTIAENQRRANQAHKNSKSKPERNPGNGKTR